MRSADALPRVPRKTRSSMRGGEGFARRLNDHRSASRRGRRPRALHGSPYGSKQAPWRYLLEVVRGPEVLLGPHS